MAYTGTGVVSYGFPLDDFTFTYLLTGVAGDDAVAAAAGRAVSQDTAAASSVKLADDGDPIFGRVFLAENRTSLGFVTAAVQRKFKERLPAATGHGIGLGDSVVGAGDGLVRLAAADEANETIVVETGADYVVVEKL